MVKPGHPDPAALVFFQVRDRNAMKVTSFRYRNLMVFAALITSLIYLFICLDLIFATHPLRVWLTALSFVPAFLIVWTVLNDLGDARHALATQNWLIDSVNWNIERLRAHGLGQLPESGDEAIGRVAQVARWPWGIHHTEYLGHLDAAARKWWTLYDPSDPTTAPTNEMVSDWLQAERSLSREKARAIASMLRPDGLPTGPRR